MNTYIYIAPIRLFSEALERFQWCDFLSYNSASCLFDSNWLSL